MNKVWQSVQHLEIGPGHHQQRLDNFLFTALKGLPKSRVYKLLRSGQIRVNKGRKKPDYRLNTGDMVRIPPVELVERDPGQVPDFLLEQVENAVLHEQDDFLVLNKPAGMPVHAGSGIRFGVIESLRQARPQEPMLELVHRLDRDTSGLLLIARNRPCMLKLHELFSSHEAISKSYQALVCGRWQGGEQLIDQPLQKNNLQGGERMVQVDPEGKPARSRFIPLHYTDRASLMEVEIYTGRTHQIRVHAVWAGHPIVGDRKYAEPGCNQFFKNLGYKRMFLHAHTLAFQLDQAYQFTAPLDPEWQRLLQQLDTL